MRSHFGTSLLGFLLVPALCAQQGSGGDKDRIQREIEQQREHMRQGSLVRINVRVTVRLKNQNKMVGVVKNGRFVERAEGLEFVEAERKSAGAGIRVWYYDGTTSCIFLPYDEIETYTIGQRLSEAQVKAIEERLEVERKRSDESREAARKKREDDQRKDGNDDKTGAAKGDKDDTGQDAAADGKDELAPAKKKELLALVTEFPAEKGWSAEKAVEIEKRKTSLHVFPSATEKRFLEVLEDWKRGVALVKASEAKKAAPAK